MGKMIKINIFLFLLVLSGCMTMPTSQVPGATIADNKLKADVIKMINMVEKVQAPGCSYSIIDTKFIGKEGDVFLEEWTILSCGKRIIYPVKFMPSSKGGTDFVVTTPDRKSR